MYTYAFLNAPAQKLYLPPGIAGSVYLLTGTYLSAVVELNVSPEALEEDEERLMQAVLSHDRVICELFRQTPLLPLRFGTCFVSESALLAHLESDASEYLEKLDSLAGKAEYTLKFIPREDPALSDAESLILQTKGKQYLLAKKQRYQQAQNFQTQQAAEWENIRDAIAHFYPDAIAAAARDRIQRIFLLAPLLEEPLLHQHLQNWQRACPSWELQLGGALPPYHFL